MTDHVAVRINFIDGTWVDLKGYIVEVRDGVLRVRTSTNMSRRDEWESFPLVNIKRWSTS